MAAPGQRVPKKLALERVETNQKRIAEFRAAYALHGIPVSEETIAMMAAQKPLDVRFVKGEPEPEEETP